MDISQLLKGIKSTKINLEVSGICMNTENAQQGDLFVALQGKSSHGVKHIDSAIDKGCVAVLVESQDIECSIPSIRVDSLSDHLESIASVFYTNAKKVKLIGITGTNGKTSVGYFVSQLLDHLGVNNGFIGTLGISNNDDKKLTVSNTTPDIFTLYRALEGYHNSDINMAVVEVSSHSIHQNRISGLNFTQAIFTNLTQDHLDYHGTLKEYMRIKGKLFSLDSIETVIINKDDANCKYFLEQSIGKKIVTFGLSDYQSYRPNNNGFLCQIENYIFETSMLGEFNLSNILAAINSVEQLGFDIDKVIPLIAKLRPPAGRMHKINKSLVWVDYAHTPDAISNAIATLNQHYPEHKVRIVFGCGGSRDKDKRAKMGKIASKNANTIILTNDNPREEDPNDIIDDISSGIVDGTKVDVILDRRLAIETAVATLKEDECLLIAGKGHESVQQFKDRVINFNDIEIAQNAAI